MELIDKVKAYLSSYLPEEDIPSDEVIGQFVSDSNTPNPYRIIYNMVVAATMREALYAEKFSDDGVSYESGKGLSSLEKLLPAFDAQVKRWDVDNGEVYIGFKYPEDSFSERFEEYAV